MYLTIFKNCFLVFWIFSFLGHYLEIIWVWVNHFVFVYPMWIPDTPTVIPLAPPYGIGVVAVILFSLPLAERYKLNPMAIFILNFIITGIVEYLCASFLVFLLVIINFGIIQTSLLTLMVMFA